MDIVSFVITFFINKNVQFLTAYLCWNAADNLQSRHEVLEAGMRLRSYNDNSSTFELPPDDIRREGIVVDLTCPYTTELLEQASMSRSFKLRYSWLLLHGDTYNKSQVEEFLEDLEILPDADVTWSSTDALLEVYRVRSGYPLQITKIGDNRNEYELVTSTNFLSKTLLRKNLSNIILKAGNIINEPQPFGSSILSHRDYKVTYSLLEHLAEDFNIRYKEYSVEQYGDLQPNGTFDGIVGMFERGEIEISLVGMFMRVNRWPVMHYCTEALQIRGIFIFRQPQQSRVANMFLLPISCGVWTASAVVFTGAALVLIILSRALASMDETLDQLTPLEAFSFAIGTVCQQGFHVTPELVSVRIVMFFTLITSLFVFTSYSAMIVAILQTPSDGIQSVADIIDSPFQVSVQDTFYKRTYFEESNESTSHALYKHKLKHQGENAYISAVEGINRMRNSIHAFQVEEIAAYEVISKTFMEPEKCNLKIILAFKLPVLAITVRKHSGYKEMVMVRTLWYRECGLFSRAQAAVRTPRPQCAGAGGGFVSVGLPDVLPAMYALLLGVAAAVLIAIAEGGVWRVRRGYAARNVVARHSAASISAASAASARQSSSRAAAAHSTRAVPLASCERYSGVSPSGSVYSDMLDISH